MSQLKTILSPAGLLYGKIAGLRNALYDRGIFKTHSLGARTISVGNITTGGTGKTPLVALVAGILAQNGERVCILTRGYGRENARERVLVSDGENVLAHAKTGGDEPVELARKLVGKAIVVADADRVAAAKWAMEKFGVTAFVLDDGFQHRRAKRDLDIVCIDATSPFGSGRILPAGTLREPLFNLKRADAIVITRANLIDDIEDLKSRISNLNSACPTFSCADRVTEIISLDEFHAGPGIRRPEEDVETSENFKLLKLLRPFIFSGLGNPAGFNKYIGDNFDIAGSRQWPDHYFYTQSDIDLMEKKSVGTGGEILVTTAKDAVKLQGLRLTLPCYVVMIAPSINDQEGFRKLIVSS